MEHDLFPTGAEGVGCWVPLAFALTRLRSPETLGPILEATLVNPLLILN